MKDLKDIIEKLRAPKDLYNKFGQYKYRSCESILEAVKPLLAERGCLLNLSDCVVCIGGANYVRAEATFISSTGEKMNADGWAREDMDKKGMDAPQMTGTASSYARKYALNGLFCIDDAKDPDTDEYRNEKTARKQSHTTKPATVPQPTPQPPKKVISERTLSVPEQVQNMLSMLQEGAAVAHANGLDFSPIIFLREKGFEIEEGVGTKITNLFYNNNQ